MCSVLLLLVTAFAGTHKQIGFHNFTYIYVAFSSTVIIFFEQILPCKTQWSTAYIAATVRFLRLECCLLWTT